MSVWNMLFVAGALILIAITKLSSSRKNNVEENVSNWNNVNVDIFSTTYNPNNT
jgi:hypothetical protein